jgi:lincosamide nucleotidyltransferase A/C/D/E
VPTTRDDVLWLLDTIAAQGGHPIIAGGWGVDALLGTHTRAHRDLDVLIDQAVVPALVDALRDAGFVVTTDALPVRIELSDIGADRHIDLHPVFDDGRGGCWLHGPDDTRVDHPADAVVTGVIGGRSVRCLSATRQIELHAGYDARDVDDHDLARLGELEP